MILKFTTKRDINGNRKPLFIDTDKKIYACQSVMWYCMENVTEIKVHDRARMIDDLNNNGFIKVDYI